MLSPELKRLLECETSPNGDPAHTIAGYLALREEARAALPVLKAAATQKAGPEGVTEVIAKRFALYPQPNRSEGEWASWWADYFETLADVPWSALEAAMASWVADPASEYLPKPGKLLELARTTPNKSIRSYERARRAVEYESPQQIAQAASGDFGPRPEPTAEERAEVRAMLQAFKAQMAERAPTNLTVHMPSTAGKPDERGITKEMRALMAQRRDQ